MRTSDGDGVGPSTRSWFGSDRLGVGEHVRGVHEALLAVLDGLDEVFGDTATDGATITVSRPTAPRSTPHPRRPTEHRTVDDADKVDAGSTEVSSSPVCGSDDRSTTRPDTLSGRAR